MRAPQWLRALEIPEFCISSSSSAQGEGREKTSFSIKPAKGDQIWRVQVDGCWLADSDRKRVDYLFWGSSASGRKVVLLVELKTGDLGKALKQIESTLDWLCKRAGGSGIHTDLHEDSPGHDRHDSGGVQVHIVLSRGVPQRQLERARVRRRYGVVIYPKTRRREYSGIDNLPRS